MTEREILYGVIFTVGFLYLVYRIGVYRGMNGSFFIAGQAEGGLGYSFESEKNFKETLEKIGKLAKENKNLQAWEFFVGFLLDKKEGCEITEENLQAWLVESEKLRTGKIGEEKRSHILELYPKMVKSLID